MNWFVFMKGGIDMMEYRPILWLMGGLDPLGASGVSLDLRIVAQRPVHPCVLVTRLTVQTLTSFDGDQQAVNPLFLAQCISLKAAHPPRAVKLGMLGTEAQWDQLLEVLSGLDCPLVFDPIISTSSGTKVLSDDLLHKVIRDLLPKVSLVTPNLREAELLVGFKISTEHDFVRAAKKMGSYGVQAVFIKGGHWVPDGEADEIRGFYWDGQQGFWLITKRQPHSCRGTGCALSSLIAAELCHGTSMIDSLVIGQRQLDLAYRRAYHPKNLHGALPRLLPTPRGDEFCLAHRMIPYQYGQRERVEFPKVGGGLGSVDDALGFYPIVPSFEWVRRLGDLGVKTIQLRVKHMETTQLEQVIKQSVAYAQTKGVRLFINDYWFLAVKYQAYGVHLGQEDLAALDYSQLL